MLPTAWMGRLVHKGRGDTLISSAERRIVNAIFVECEDMARGKLIINAFLAEDLASNEAYLEIADAINEQRIAFNAATDIAK